MNKAAVQTKPTPKREQILEAATRVFLDCGFGNASMDGIAAAAGVSKQTIYSHFAGKDALFGAIVRDKCDQLLGAMSPPEGEWDDPEEVLRDVARRFYYLVLAPDNMAHFRAIIAESSRFPELARVFYDSGPRLAADNLAAYLTEMDRRKILLIGDPLRTARLFFGMLRGDLYFRQVLGIAAEPSAEDIEQSVSEAVQVFLAAHTP